LKDQVAAFRAEIDKRQGRPNRPDDEPIEKQKPNYNATGLLAKETNTVLGTKVVLKYHEPPEARKSPSSKQWTLVTYKDNEIIETIKLWKQSCWLIGREATVTDIRVDHPHASGQHAAIQFRNVKKKAKDELGSLVMKEVVRPYIIDLESTHGTFLNGEELDKAQFVEIRNNDIMTIASSDREYQFFLPPTDANE
jgi:smad nuclear-interacting protein 1